APVKPLCCRGGGKGRPADAPSPGGSVEAEVVHEDRALRPRLVRAGVHYEYELAHLVEVEPPVRLRVERAKASEGDGHPPPGRARTHGAEPPFRAFVRGSRVGVAHLHPHAVLAVPTHGEDETLGAGE